MDEERKEYLKQYKKENLKRIALDVKGDDYEQIKLAAELDGVSMSRYIKSLIAEDLKKKRDTIAYKIASQRKDMVGSPLDYYKNEPKQKLERVVYTDIDKVTGLNRGMAVALLTSEEAVQFREEQKRKLEN